MAAQTDAHEILSVLLSDKRTKVDIASPMRGSALHLAARVQIEWEVSDHARCYF